MILSIDQSLTGTGVCYLSKTGEMQTKLIKTNAKQPWSERMDCILSGIDSFFDLSSITLENKSPVEIVVMEGYAYAGSIKGFVLGELGGCIKYHFHEKGFTVPQISIAHHKMFIARNGRATKKEYIKALKIRFNIEEKNDNIADAIGMALLTRAYLNPSKCVVYDKAVFAKMKGYMNV